MRSFLGFSVILLLGACSGGELRNQPDTSKVPGDPERAGAPTKHGLEATLSIEQEPEKNRVVFVLEIKNVSSNPRPFVPVYDFGTTAPGLVSRGTDAVLRIEQLSGPLPKGLGMIHAPFHRPRPKVEILAPGEVRQYRNRQWLSAGRYKAIAEYKALSDIHFWGKPEYHVVSNSIEFEVAP